MDTVFIERLTLTTTIGIHEWERKNLQRVEIDAKMIRKEISPSDRRTPSYVDYAEASRIIIALVEREKFNLLEDMAEKIVELLMDRFSLSGVELRISKPAAVPQAKRVGILVQRGEQN